MIVLLALLVVVALVAAAVVGLGRLALVRRPDAEGLLAGAGGLAAGLAVVVVAVVVGGALFGVVGLRGGGHEEETGTPAPAKAEPPPAPSPRPVASAAVPDALGPVVSMEAGTFRGPAPAVGGLEPTTVLRMQVAGFDPFTAARARQCVEGEAVVCGNAVDVQFGHDGTASFQYLVVDDFAPTTGSGRCRAGAAPCSIVVEPVDGGERRAVVRTVFHDQVPPPPRVRVSPRVDLADGARVTVTVAGGAPGARLEAVLCAAPDRAGRRRCGPPGPSAPVTVAADGTARARLVVRPGPVGEERAPCGRGHPCGVSVVSALGTPAGPAVPVTFAAGAGAHYDGGRLALGLGAAAVLLALALGLVRATDWSPIGEEAAPEIDEAEYADLDALVAALPPEDELDDALR